MHGIVSPLGIAIFPGAMLFHALAVARALIRVPRFRGTPDLDPLKMGPYPVAPEHAYAQGLRDPPSNSPCTTGPWPQGPGPWARGFTYTIR